jgi:sterol desaturase/sphingolipid hydroxylase (fatty acid hydroxylase superfamily)
VGLRVPSKTLRERSIVSSDRSTHCQSMSVTWTTEPQPILSRTVPKAITYGLYPGLVGGGFLFGVFAIRSGMNRSVVLPAVLFPSIVVSILVEWRYPLKRKWSMTKRTVFRRDVPYLVIASIVARASEAAVTEVARRSLPNDGFGVVAKLPLALQVILAVLLFDLLWYGYHRFAHSSGRLWRVHGAHHAPSQMYVLMHGVFHPFDELFVRFVLGLVVFRFVGFRPDASFLAVLLIGSVGIVSHINADIRIWALNHVFIGPELHRYHHSASHRGNYGTVTSIWDQLFGTFTFFSQPPLALGLAHSTDYPNPESIGRVLLWPLRSTSDSVQ